MTDHAKHPARASMLITLGWAAYLACSWTWCIGMFLPVLLLRDYGPWSFAAFAIPNILGAGAMGWVLMNPGAGRGLVDRHAGAMRAFSVVTLAFHAFFILWIFTSQGPNPAVPLLAAAGLAASLLLIKCIRGEPAVLRLSAALWTLSLLAALAVGSLMGGWDARPGPPSPATPGAGLVWMLPVIAFGFILCPYLDLSFHLARARTRPMQGAAAFSVGFGLLFAAMILFTLLYAPLFLRADAGPGGAAIAAMDWSSPLIAGIVLAHILAQTLFTVFIHTRRLAATPGGPAPRLIIAALAGAAALGLASTALPDLLDTLGMAFGEIVYRCFMAFYGLVFPAYVWLIMIPTRDGHAGLLGAAGRRKLRVWALTVGIAAPMFWVGFIHGVEWWLIPGLAVILLARLPLNRATPR
jgi:hypothetical protein